MKSNEIDKKKIESLLPHREPMLLIDKLINIVHLKSATALVNVRKESFYHVKIKKRKKTMLEVALNRRKKYMSLRQLKLLLKEKQINTIKRYIEFKRLNKNLIPSDPRNYYGRRGHEIKWNDVFEK